MEQTDNIFAAAKFNNASVVLKLCEHELNDPNELSENGLTALHICCTYGCLESAVVLLYFGANVNLVDRENRWTALHRSIYFRHFKLTWLLVRAGALLDVGYEDLSPFEGSHPAHDYEGLTPMALLSTLLSSPSSHSSFCRQLTQPNTRLLQVGCVFSFGKADFQLGVPLPKAQSDVTKPRLVALPGNESIQSVAANKFHSLALTDEGQVFSWGHGKGGRLGRGDELTQPLPQHVSIERTSIGANPFFTRVRVTALAAGLNHSLALTSLGEIFSWGSDRFGQLGHNQSDSLSLQPRLIELLQREHVCVLGIAAGEAHSVCYGSDGSVFTWGCGKAGQLGLKANELSSSEIAAVPKRVRLPIQYTDPAKKSLEVCQVAAGFDSTLVLARRSLSSASSSAVSSPGQVFQWGNGITLPVKVIFPAPKLPQSTSQMQIQSRNLDSAAVLFGEDSVSIAQVTAGQYHHAGVCSRGHVYTWGFGGDQLGHINGSLTHECSSPRRVEALLPGRGGSKMAAVAATRNRTCTLSVTGDLYSWGATNSDEQGVLGHGPGSSYEPVPKQVMGIKRTAQVAIGETHTLVLSKYSRPPLPLSDLFTSVGLVDVETVSNQVGDAEALGTGDESFRRPRSRTAASRSNSYGDLMSDDDDDQNSNGNNDSEHEFSMKAECEVPTLKAICERSLARATDLRNVANLMTHAEALQAPMLKQFCSDFITMNLDMILIQSKPSDLDALLEEYSFQRVLETIQLQSGSMNPWSSDCNSPASCRQSRTIPGERRDRSGSTGSDYSPAQRSKPSASEKPKQNLDTAESVAKIMRAVKKKLAHIDELDAKRERSQSLSKEQLEKVGKRSSLTSELSRLQLIFNRLEREEAIVAKAILSRAVNKAQSKEDEMAHCAVNSAKMLETEANEVFQAVAAVSMASATQVAKVETTPVVTPSKASNGAVNVTKGKRGKFMTLKDFEQQRSAPVIQQPQEQQTMVPMSFEAYGTMLSDGSSVRASNSTVSPWSQVNAKAVNSPSISAMAPNGRTVLSPPSYNPATTAATTAPSSVHIVATKTPVKAPVLTPNIIAISTIGNRSAHRASLTAEATSPSPGGLSLAAFIKPNSKVAKALNQNQNSPDKKKSPAVSGTDTKSPWSKASPAAVQLPTPVVVPLSSSLTSSTSKKSFLEIQQDEEKLRLQCAATAGTLSGHESGQTPWFVDRRMRADSLDKVIRQETIKREEELELQEALRAIELLEKREKEQLLQAGKVASTPPQKVPNRRGNARKGVDRG